MAAARDRGSSPGPGRVPLVGGTGTGGWLNRSGEGNAAPGPDAVNLPPARLLPVGSPARGAGLRSRAGC